jgi:hypothetical protein
MKPLTTMRRAQHQDQRTYIGVYQRAVLREDHLRVFENTEGSLARLRGPHLRLKVHRHNSHTEIVLVEERANLGRERHLGLVQ